MYSFSQYTEASVDGKYIKERPHIRCPDSFLDALHVPFSGDIMEIMAKPGKLLSLGILGSGH